MRVDDRPTAARAPAAIDRLHGVSTRLLEGRGIERLCEEIVDAAVDLMGSDAGSMQILDVERNELRLVAWGGFHPDSATFWERVDVGSGSTCGQALARGERVVVPDVEHSFVAGTPDLAEYRRSGLVAIQSTPLMSRGGELVGMVSTHWRRRHEPAEAELRLLDVLARQAADVIELQRANAGLRGLHERQALLLALSDRLRALADPAEIQGAATRFLGEHLGADRAAYAEARPDGEILEVAHEWTSSPSPSPLAEDGFDGLGSFWAALLGKGTPCVVEDAATDPRVPSETVAAWERRGVRSAIAYPLIEHGRLFAAVVVHHGGPRRWSEDEVWLVREAGERSWEAVERARAQTAQRASERRYRTLFETMDEGFVVLELVRDDDGNAIDMRYLEVNPAFERLTSIEPDAAVGRLLGEVLPVDLERVLPAYERVALTGEPRTYEHYSQPFERWLEVTVLPYAGDSVAVLYHDITARKQNEEAALRRHRLKAERAERGRWARELHDETLQGLGAVQMQLVAALPDAGTARPQLEETIGIVRTQIANLRALISELRPPALAEYGLRSALGALVADVAGHDRPKIDLLVSLGREAEERRFPADVELTVYRAVQQALTNAIQHAGARRIDVRVRAWRGKVEATVTDDGSGFDPSLPTEGFGLAGMRDRAQVVGGTLRVESAPGLGTTVALELPIRGAAEIARS